MANVFLATAASFLCVFFSFSLVSESCNGPRIVRPHWRTRIQQTAVRSTAKWKTSTEQQSNVPLCNVEVDSERETERSATATATVTASCRHILCLRLCHRSVRCALQQSMFDRQTVRTCCWSLFTSLYQFYVSFVRVQFWLRSILRCFVASNKPI